jgi:hypothetical protein
MLYALLVAAEQLRNLDAAVLVEVEDPKGEISKHRPELEKLLSDYGCAWEWEEV